MAKKLRVYDLARELNLDNSEVIRELQHLGVPVTSHSNTVEDRLADILRKKMKTEVVEVAPPAPEEPIREPQKEVAEARPSVAPVKEEPTEAPPVTAPPPAKVEMKPAEPEVEQKPAQKPGSQPESTQEAVPERGKKGLIR